MASTGRVVPSIRWTTCSTSHPQTSLFRAQVVEGLPKTGVLYHNPRGQTVGPPTTVFGLPLIKPPYARVTAVDLKTGDRLWMVPHGNTPEPIKKNPRLQGVEIPNTGAQTHGTGLLVTSTLLFGGEGGATPVLRAWDKKTGAVVAEIAVAGSDHRIPRHLYEGRAAVHRCGGTGWRRGGNRGARASSCDGTRRPWTAVTQDLR